MKKILAGISFAAMLVASPAFAFYQATDAPEFVSIYPNESAFWVPSQGDTESTQTQFETEDFFNKKKIATKMFQVPHAKLPGAQFSLWGGNYAPTGRLIIQSRAPYNREWTQDAKRGTGGGALECQSADGLTITVDIAIGASITEQDAAKYLYNFGIEPPRDPNDRTKMGNREDPQVLFTSVYYGYPLEYAMDRKVHGQVSTLICNEIASHTLEEDKARAAVILNDTIKEITPWLLERGITLDYLGYAGRWGFDPSVQEAINRNFNSSQEAVAAKALEPYKDTLLTLAYVDAVRKLSSTWDGKLPSSLSGLWVLPANILASFTDTLKAVVTQVAPK